MNKLKLLIALADLLWSLRKTVKDIRYTRRTESAKRAAIELNKELDLEAIKRAGEAVQARIANGYYRNITDLPKALNAEIELQKILVRKEL